MRRRDLIAATLAFGVAPVARAAAKTTVLELFTSQSCSSCPPADALLGKLAKRQDVIALAWHVDYWNNLGWRDPYASRLATERQKVYAQRLASMVFTPALIVGGANVVVGSDVSAVEAAITSASPLTVPVTISHTSGGPVAEIGAGSGPLTALLATYDAEHTTDVGAGENEGSRLREYHIVRQVTELGKLDGTARRFDLPAIDRGQGAVILLQSADLRIVGAGELRPS